MRKRAERAAKFGIPAEEQLVYAPDTDAAVLRARAAKFGTAYEPAEAALMEMDLFEARREAAPDVERRPEAVHVYGIDVLSTADLFSYFREYGPTFVEWLDDSSCAWAGLSARAARAPAAGRGSRE